jgi:hypothetical protein
LAKPKKDAVDVLNIDTPDPEFKPLSKVSNSRKALEQLKAANAIDTLEPVFTPQPSGEWRLTKAWWANASEDERQDQVYGLAFLNAAKPKQIAQYYSIKESDLKQYAEQWEMGTAARILKINGHQMRWGLSTSIPNAKFFLGLQFAQQVQNPQHEDVKSIDEGAGAITIRVLTKEDRPSVLPTIIDSTSNYLEVGNDNY